MVSDRRCSRYASTQFRSLADRIWNPRLGFRWQTSSGQLSWKRVKSPYSLLLGAWTGKTTIVRVILEMYDTWGWKTLLASPTGRAAKRLAETTGRRAQTIHRLLEFGYEADMGLRFRRNADNPLKADAVIIDEVSMVDLRLFYHLLQAISPGTRLIMVGDADQLPPVGPGQPLGDMLESGIVPSVRLTEVFRQAKTSLIVTNAHKINRGEFPRFNSPHGDFFLVEEKETANMSGLIVDLVKQRLPAHYGFDPMEDIQVLSPLRRTRAGTETLNRHLQAALNPPRPDREEVSFGDHVFRIGDRVMQIENDYDKQVFNGDMGRIVSLNREEQNMIIELSKQRVFATQLTSEVIGISWSCPMLYLCIRARK